MNIVKLRNPTIPKVVTVLMKRLCPLNAYSPKSLKTLRRFKYVIGPPPNIGWVAHSCMLDFQMPLRPLKLEIEL